MSSVIVITPLIIANWPAITAAVYAAIGTMGFVAARQSAAAAVAAGVSETNRTEIEVEESDILQDMGGTGQELVVEREGVRAIFSRDARGALKVCMEGEGHSKGELRRIGQELIGRVTQQYVYHRVVTELKQRNMTIVEEAVEEDKTVRIRVRNW